MTPPRGVWWARPPRWIRSTKWSDAWWITWPMLRPVCPLDRAVRRMMGQALPSDPVLDRVAHPARDWDLWLNRAAHREAPLDLAVHLAMDRHLPVDRASIQWRGGLDSRAGGGWSGRKQPPDPSFRVSLTRGEAGQIVRRPITRPLNRLLDWGRALDRSRGRRSIKLTAAPACCPTGYRPFRLTITLPVV